MLRRCENQEKHLRNSHTSEVPPHKEQDPQCAPSVNRLEDYGLPPFVLLSEPKFRWSDSVDGKQFAHSIRLAYKEIAHWRNSIFTVPHGIVGKSFVAELSRLLRAYGESNVIESIALTAAIMLPPLLLQKPHPKDKVKDNISCLEKRLTLWKECNICELLHEGNSI